MELFNLGKSGPTSKTPIGSWPPVPTMTLKDSSWAQKRLLSVNRIVSDDWSVPDDCIAPEATSYVYAVQVFGTPNEMAPIVIPFNDHTSSNPS